MKKEKLFLFLLLALFVPVSTWADNWAYTLQVSYGSNTKSYNFGNTSNSTDVITWTVPVTGSELRTYASTGGDVSFQLKVSGSTTSALGLSNETSVTLGTEYSGLTTNDNYYFTLNISGHDSDADVYYFTFVSGKGGNGSNNRTTGSLTVAASSSTVYEILKSSDSNTTWASVSSGMTLTDSDLPFKLRKRDGTSSEYFSSITNTVSSTALAYSLVADESSASGYNVTDGTTSGLGYTLTYTTSDPLTVTLTKITNTFSPILFLYSHGNSSAGYSTKEYPLSWDGTRYSTMLSAKELDNYDYTNVIHFFIKTGDGSYLSSSGWTSIADGETKDISTTLSSYNSNTPDLYLSWSSDWVTNNNYLRFTFSGTESSGTVGLTLVGAPTYTLTYDGGTISGTSDGGNITFTLPEAAYSNTDGLSFNLSRTMSGTTNYYNGSALTNGTALTTSLADNGVMGSAFTLASGLGDNAPGGNITVTLNPNTPSVTITFDSKTDVKNSSYYLVIPEITGDNCVENFRMTAARNRYLSDVSHDGSWVKGADNADFYNINFKSDELWDSKKNAKYSGTLHWYIMKGDGSAKYYPSGTGGIHLGFRNNTDNNGGLNGMNGYREVYADANRGTGTPATDNCFYFVNEETFTSSDWKSMSYTFMLDVSSNKVAIVVNRSIDEDNTYNNGTGYYLVGNFTADRDTKLEPWTDDKDHRRAMTKYIYKNNVARTEAQWYTFNNNSSSTASADSVVYVAHVSKPDGGWTDLYYLIAPNSLAAASGWGSGTSGDPWRYIYRPEIQDYNHYHTGSEGAGRYDVDSRSLRGAMIQNDNVEMNTALNPKMEDAIASAGVSSVDEIDSYDFMFNVTYSTYRLRFNKKKTLRLYDMENVYYKSTTANRKVEGLGGYKYFTTYAANSAYIKPDAVDAYVVTDVRQESGKGVVTLEKFDATGTDSKGNTVSVLPRNFGLVLASKEDPAGGSIYDVEHTNDNAKMNYVEFSLSPTADGTEEGSGTNLLQPQYDYAWIVRNYTNGNDTYYNYIWSAYRRGAWNVNRTDEYEDGTGKKLFDLGFWVVQMYGSAISESSAYLSLKEGLLPEVVGTSRDMTEYTKGGAKKMPGLIISFEGNDPTGISAVQPKDRQTDDAYYTLQGIRVSKPTMRGVYIHNGKKIIKK